MRKRVTTVLLVLLLLTGLSLLLYPTASEWLARRRQARAMQTYDAAVADTTESDALWAAAQAYNDALWQMPDRYAPSAEQHAAYTALLDPNGNGIIGTVEIPCIDVRLPICHGVDAIALQTNVGHIEGSSLPVGGSGTHCVLSGHRGLPSAQLFTDLDKVTEGDTFLLHVLGRTLTYEVDQILVVEPQETEALDLVKGEDLCTLVTCTPYGINTHRLLVRGHRIENAPMVESAAADAVYLLPPSAATVAAASFFFVLLISVVLRRRSVGGKAKNL